MKASSVFCAFHPSPLLVGIVGAALGSGSIHAVEFLVDWGGDYVSNNQEFSGIYSDVPNLDLDNDTVLDDSRFGYAYNAAAPTVFSPSAGYSGTSGTFYGGFAINTIDNPSAAGDTLQPNSQGVHQNGLTDHIKFQTQHSGNHHHTFALFTYWDKADFLNGGNAVNVSLETMSTFSLEIRNSTNVQDDIHLHFVIRQGNQFYASEAFFGGTGISQTELGYLGIIPDGGIATYTPSSHPTLGWKAYNPNGLDLQWSHGPWVNPTFNDITAVGFYFDTLGFTQNNSDLEIDAFSFTGIPEPASAVLALAGFSALLLRRRRQIA